MRNGVFLTKKSISLRSVVSGHIPLFTLIITYFLTRLPYIGFVPLWDGAVYYWFARYAKIGVTTVETHGHISFLYMWLVSVPARLAGERIELFNCFLILFAICSIYAFYKLLEIFLGKYVSGPEIGLFTAVFAFHPTVLSNTINLNLDQGLMIFYLLFLLSYLKERYFFATVFAVFLIFTKETALLLLPATMITAFLCYPGKRQRKSITGTLQLLSLVMLCFGVYAFHKTQIAGQPLFWHGLGGVDQLFSKFMTFPETGGYFKVQLVQLFVMNFQWVLTIIFMIFLVAFPVFFRRRIPEDAENNILFCGALFFVLFLLLSRFYPYSNSRYLLVLFPVFLLLFSQLTILCVPEKSLRMGLCAFFLFLFALSLYQTTDPVSRRIFGTFRFGEHEMLKMTSVAGDGCGYGRDQLVYNFQFMQFHYMQNLVFREIRPDQDTIILSSREAWPSALMGRLRRDNYQRTVAKKNSILPVYETVEEFRKRASGTPEAYYIAYPNVDNGKQISYLASRFSYSNNIIVKSKGYSLEVVRFYNDRSGFVAPDKTARKIIKASVRSGSRESFTNVVMEDMVCSDGKTPP